MRVVVAIKVTLYYPAHARGNGLVDVFRRLLRHQINKWCGFLVSRHGAQMLEAAAGPIEADR
jgi:hypothetical protein